MPTSMKLVCKRSPMQSVSLLPCNSATKAVLLPSASFCEQTHRSLCRLVRFLGAYLPFAANPVKVGPTYIENMILIDYE